MADNPFSILGIDREASDKDVKERMSANKMVAF